MANFSGLRLIIASLAAVCSMTFATTAPAYFDSGGGTATTSDLTYVYGNVLVISLSDFRAPAFDLMPVIKEDRIASHPPAFRPKAIKERASRSAVRPTAVSGWRSGRTRTLAA